MSDGVPVAGTSDQVQVKLHFFDMNFSKFLILKRIDRKFLICMDLG